MVTDFKMTFTGDLVKIAWQNNNFVFKVSIPKKVAMVLSKIPASYQEPSWPSCFGEGKLPIEWFEFLVSLSLKSVEMGKIK